MSSAGVSQKRKAATRKESAETRDHVSCQGMEVDDKSLEDLGFVSSAVSDSAGWRELLRVKHVCDKKCTEERFKFYDLAAIVVEEEWQAAHDQPLQERLWLQADRKWRIKSGQCS